MIFLVHYYQPLARLYSDVNGPLGLAGHKLRYIRSPGVAVIVAISSFSLARWHCDELLVMSYSLRLLHVNAMIILEKMNK